MATEQPAKRQSERAEARKLIRPSRAPLSDDGRFAIDFSRVPQGFTMEWKRETLFGLRDRRNLTTILANHWEPVPHKMQPHVYGKTATGDDEHVKVDGLGLYMRPTYLCDDAHLEDNETAAYQTNQQLQSLRLQSREQLGPGGAGHTKITREVVKVAQPVDG